MTADPDEQGARAGAPFVDRPVGELEGATAAAGSAAGAWGLPAPVLLGRGMNALFTAGDVVLRVGRPTAAGATAYELAAALTDLGLRVASPATGDVLVHDGLTVTGWERLQPAGEVAWDDVGAMVARLHSLDVGRLPSGYPVPACTAYPWWHFDEVLADVGPDIDPEARAAITAAVERHRGWEAARPWVVCHGDVHPGNVVPTLAGPVLVDWDLLCVGPPAWDHAPLRSMVARWGTPAAAYTAFARGYGRSWSDDPLGDALTELRLVAATLMRVRAGRRDPAARAEAERRLAWWRGDADAPIWAVQ